MPQIVESGGKRSVVETFLAQCRRGPREFDRPGAMLMLLVWPVSAGKRRYGSQDLDGDRRQGLGSSLLHFSKQVPQRSGCAPSPTAVAAEDVTQRGRISEEDGCPYQCDRRWPRSAPARRGCELGAPLVPTRPAALPPL